MVIPGNNLVGLDTMEIRQETRELRRAKFQECLELDMDRLTKECLDGAERLTWADLKVSPTTMDQWIGTLSEALVRLRTVRDAKVQTVMS